MTDHFASAALDESRWIPALRALGEATGSSYGQMIGIGGAATIPFNWVSDLPKEAITTFVEIDGGNPRVNPRVAAGLEASVLRVVHEGDLAAAAPRIRSTVWNDFARDYDIPFGCQTNLAIDREGVVGLALLRGRRQGHSKAADRALFARVAPHARSAVRMQSALEHAGAKLITGALETVVLNADPARLPVMLDICRVPSASWAFTSRPHIMAIVRTGRRWHGAAAEILQQIYRLSPAEADVALRLARGESRARIAGERNTSVETVRVQVKTVFAKLGVNRETELVVLLGGVLQV